MVEALVSRIRQELQKVITENAEQELKLVTGVEGEVERVQRDLESIQGVLADAEEKQIVDDGVKHWLERLKQVAYDLEDVVDEWRTLILKLKIEGPQSFYVTEKVCPFLPCFDFSREVVGHNNIGSKFREISQELDPIARERDLFQLERREIRQPRPFESTSTDDVFKLHGRDDVKKDIVSELLAGNEVKTVSIVGMSGIGKTFLAQQICNDHKVRAFFGNIIWVCVSDLSDEDVIAKAILGGFHPNSIIRLRDPIPLDFVLIKICQKVRHEKFLLVLDDLWTDGDEDLGSLKVALQQGFPGSRILVTTREKLVAMEFGSSKVFRLEVLSDEDCWSILSQLAFMGKDCDLCQNLEDIGREIAKKCKGVPFAANILGSLLREKKNRDEWQNILHSEIWELDVANEYIWRPLLLSYYDLPSEIKPSLLYCAIFPKGFSIRPDLLIKYWMALGYLNSQNLEMEEKKGEEYFKFLASRSFFQDFEKVSRWNTSLTHCKMHGIIHDLVQYLTNEVIAAVEVDSKENLRQGSRRTRYLRLTILENDKFPVFIEGIEQLRTLVSIGQYFDLTGEGLETLFKRAKCLRLLEFRLDQFPCMLAKKIPNAIGELIHLRYLNLGGNEKLQELPEELCELYNLQYFILFACFSLKKLPEEIWKLTNLRLLDTRLCHRLEYYPKGIGRLTSLRELTSVIARVDGSDTNEFSIGDLENIDLLCGSLKIRLVGNVLDVEEAKRAKLHQKIHLSELDIDFKGRGARDFDGNDIIEALKLPSSLKIQFTRNYQ